MIINFKIVILGRYIKVDGVRVLMLFKYIKYIVINNL